MHPRATPLGGLQQGDVAVGEVDAEKPSGARGADAPAPASAKDARLLELFSNLRKASQGRPKGSRCVYVCL